MKRRFVSCAAFATCLSSAPAAAIDGMSLELGSGKGVDMGRVGVQWDWPGRIVGLGTWQLAGYLDVAAGYWHKGDTTAGQHSELFEIGVTPVLRLQPNGLAGPYIEGGLGPHLLSHSSIGARRMSTGLQFGSHVGVGFRFGGRSAYDLSYRFQHLSNAAIKRPNPGINFNQIRLQYHF